MKIGFVVNDIEKARADLIARGVEVGVDVVEELVALGRGQRGRGAALLGPVHGRVVRIEVHIDEAVVLAAIGLARRNRRRKLDLRRRPILPLGKHLQRLGPTLATRLTEVSGAWRVAKTTQRVILSARCP